ncbi:hypothetical protein [Streptococcus sp. SS-4456]|uniref:hypothetical protein n=1 Tax=Streptococcus sp. SS-4456 TaxID=3072286 RepID=UPI002FCCB529
MKRIFGILWDKIKRFFIDVIFLIYSVIAVSVIVLLLSFFTTDDWEVYLLLFAIFSTLFSTRGINSLLENHYEIINYEEWMKLENSFQLIGNIIIFSIYLSKKLLPTPFLEYKFKIINYLLLGLAQFIFAEVIVLFSLILIGFFKDHFIAKLVDLKIVGKSDNKTIHTDISE